MEYLLKKALNGETRDYEDVDGISWSSPESWFWGKILGGCGCGSSDELAEQAIKLLRHFQEEVTIDDIHKSYDWEILAHWFDSKGLIEHGSNILCSWLTAEGHTVLNTLNQFKDEEDNQL